MDIHQFKSFVIEKMLLSLARRHVIKKTEVDDNSFSIYTEGHIIHGYEHETDGVRCITITIERNKNEEPLVKLFFSLDTHYYEKIKDHISTFDADVLSPLNNVFEDFIDDQLHVISFGINDPVSRLFKYRLATVGLNKMLIARSPSGFKYSLLDSDMKQFLDNRDKGFSSNIILRRIGELDYIHKTAEMPFQPAIELFEDALSKPVDKPYHGAITIVDKKPLYYMKSPTRDCLIVILEISDDKKSCKSGYMDVEPNPLHKTWSVHGVRTTRIFYTKDLRRYQIIRGGDCVDITHIIRK